MDFRVSIGRERDGEWGEEEKLKLKKKKNRGRWICEGNEREK